uniref:EGF-like domain-containing protein n=1 Tax=Callorhinchus milii TaxID=7868 RepID=A0A4W3JPJ8_CALMI
RTDTSSALSVLLASLVCTASGQTVCRRDKFSEWRSHPEDITVKWALSRNICSDFHAECWYFGPDDQRGVAEANQALNLAQNCPLELQVGDGLFISPDLSLETRGVNLANVSGAEFGSCSHTGSPASQLLFGGKVKATSQVHPKWLTAGTHLFAEVRDEGAPLCTFGLRLNVTVKAHLCGTSNTAEPLCSGHGVCLTRPGEAGYYCRCEEPYAGDLCQEYDACHWRPCLNRGICTDKNEGDYYYYEVVAVVSTGTNCSEVVGQCKPQVCRYGYCQNVTPNTFVCECDQDHTGDTRLTPSVPQTVVLIQYFECAWDVLCM